MTGDGYDQKSIIDQEREVAYQRIHNLIDQREQAIADAHAADEDAATSRFLMSLIDQNVQVIGPLGTGVQHVRRGELGYNSRWMEAVVYQDLSFRDDPSWHPAETGCWQITVREEDDHLSVRSWHWDGETNIRYEKATIGGDYLQLDIADVYQGRAETSDALAARLAKLNTPSIVALAEAIRAVIRDNR